MGAKRVKVPGLIKEWQQIAGYQNGNSEWKFKKTTGLQGQGKERNRRS